MKRNILSDKETSDKKPSTKHPVSEAVSIGSHLLASKDFDRLYSKGMGLIEEVAAYLDGDGRKESRALNREAAFLYASESMRLTTRLMQMASWLLLQRAVSEGEISSQSAIDEKEKIKLNATPTKRGGPGWDELPPSLLDYIKKSDRFYERVMQFDKLEKHKIKEVGEKAKLMAQSTGGIAEQLARISAAFEKNK